MLQPLDNEDHFCLPGCQWYKMSGVLFDFDLSA